MANLTTSNPGLTRKVILMFFVSLLVLMATFFLPAGTFAFWQGWLYLVVLFIPLVFVVSYLLKNAPDLLERRMHYREREKEQVLIIRLSYIPFIFAYILPGFDFRFGWSHMPIWLVILSDVLVLASYLWVVNVFRTNRYASRVVEVDKGQSVISTGPYSLVRHPMYTGVAVMYLFSPLALGSYWAVIPALFILPILIYRLLDEEKVLARDLPGYTDYMKKVKYHLFPGIW